MARLSRITVANLLELSFDQQAGLDGFVNRSPNGRPLDAADIIATVENKLGRKFGWASGDASRTPEDGLIWGIHIELHPSAETLDLSDRALVVSFQTVSSWRSSASNSTGGL